MCAKRVSRRTNVLVVWLSARDRVWGFLEGWVLDRGGGEMMIFRFFFPWFFLGFLFWDVYGGRWM